MQMTFDQAFRPGLMQAFALRRRSGYVMRSEKRPGYGNSGNGRKPRPPRAGFLYILLTLLLSVVLWPVGMVLLWRKKVRMQAGTKLLISLLTLCLSVFLIVFLLTMHVENERFTNFQDRANDWLDKAYADIAVAGDAAYRKGVEAWGVMTEFADDVYVPVLNTAADGLDRGVGLATAAREKIAGLFGGDGAAVPAENGAPEDTAAPEASPEAEAEPAAQDATGEPIDIRVPENTPDPASAQALSGGLLLRTGALEPGAVPSPEAAREAEAPDAGDAAEAAPSEAAPGADGAVWAAASDAEPVDGESETAVNQAGDAEASATPAPTPTAEPTATPPVFTASVKPAGEATVYFNANGRQYHMRSACGVMRTAPAHTLSEAVAAGKQLCDVCGSPDPAVLEISRIAWADANGLFHTSDACEKFEGEWKLISLNDAVGDGLTACPDCQADIYAALYGGADDAGAAVPTAEAETVSPATPLKAAADATVYRSNNGKFYHKVEICKGMTGSTPYKLSDVAGRYKRCNTCDAPSPELIGKPCLWMDENGLCHTSDDCELFKGGYTLLLRDDALAQGKNGCSVCGANEYLVPNTVLAD